MRKGQKIAYIVAGVIAVAGVVALAGGNYVGGGREYSSRCDSGSSSLYRRKT